MNAFCTQVANDGGTPINTKKTARFREQAKGQKDVKGSTKLNKTEKTESSCSDSVLIWIRDRQ